MTVLLLYLLYAIVLNIALARRGIQERASTPTTPAPAVSKIVVVGATGGTGRAVVLQALERQYAVTALVRDPAALDITHPRLRVVRGNVLDYSTVTEAVRGQDAVVCTLGHKRFFYPTRILSAGTSNILRAMEAEGVRRLVCQTSLGIGHSVGRMGVYYSLFIIPVILPFYFWDKTRQERTVAASGTAWTIVRPVALTNAAGRGAVRHGGDVGSLIWTRRVARADVARFLLDQLSDDQYRCVAVGVSS
jgi:uncharacterized protein YbjT (DUF2867 family)